MAIKKPWHLDEEGEEKRCSEILVSGAQTLPSSTIGVGRDIVEALKHPVETGSMIIKLMSGGLQNILPEAIVKVIDPEGKSAESREIANAVGQHFQEKYGSEKNIKHVIATDPASVLMDAAIVLTGGGFAVAKAGQLTRIPALAKTGELASKTASYVDPLSATFKGVGAASNLARVTARESLGVTAGTGGGYVSQSFKSGKVGGKSSKQYTDNLRGGRDMNEVLDIALRDLEVIKKQKQSTYKENSALWKNDKEKLSFEGIDKALKSAEKLVKYRGQTKNPKGVEAVDELKTIVNEWKALEPAKFHTPEGLDALKQKIWSVVEGVGIENKTALAAAKNIYHATKTTISKQAPSYNKTMKDYEAASELIREIEKTLSLGKNASVDTAIRKLQSLMRDNVQTNYSQRVKLGQELESKGGEMFMPGLAGQQGQSWTPRSIQGGVLPVAAIATGNLPAAAGLALASSPRLVGEAAHAVGKGTGVATRALNKLPAPSYQGIQSILEILYQIKATNAGNQERGI